MSRVAETRALTWSLIVTIVLSVAALALGIGLGIRVLVFDGAFGAIGMATTWMALVAARVSRAEPSRLHPFGRATIIPLVVAIQGVAALATLIVAAGDAVIVILRGGQEVAVGVVAAYGVVVAVVSTGVAMWLGRTRTDLVRAEALQWRSGATRSAIIAVGAGLALLLAASAFSQLLPYVDPALVLISCLLVAPLPLSLIRSGAGELLEGAPPPAVAAQVDAAVADAASAFGLEAPIVRSSKAGHRLYLEVIFRVTPGWSVDQQDDIRRHILERLDGLGLEIWPWVELTADENFE